MRRNMIIALIIIVILALCLFGAWRYLQSQVKDKGGMENPAYVQNDGRFMQMSHKYARATLEGSELFITIMRGEYSDMYLGDNRSIKYDVPYSVFGLSGATYTDMLVATMGQDIWPYVFLLTDDGRVECVPIADALFAAESSGDVSFESLGILPDIAGVISISEGDVSGEAGGYMTVFAQCSDNSSYDLSDSVLAIQQQ